MDRKNLRSSLFEFANACYVLGAAVKQCWVLVAISFGISALLLFQGQGFETIIADLTAIGQRGAGVGLLIGSIVFGLLAFLSSNVILLRWQPALDARLTAFARYSAPLVLSLVVAWVVPAVLFSTTELRSEELDTLRLGFVLALSGGLLSIVGLRYRLSEAAALESGLSIFEAFATADLPGGAGWMLTRVHQLSRRLNNSLRGKPALVRYLPEYFCVLIGVLVGGQAFLHRRKFSANDESGEMLHRMLGTRVSLDEFWTLVLELFAAFVLVLALVPLALVWFYSNRLSTTAFIVLTLLLVPTIDWFCVARNAAPQLIAPARQQKLIRTIVKWSMLFIFGVSALCVAQPIPTVGGPVVVVLLALAFWISLWTLGSLLSARAKWIRAAVVTVVGIAVVLFLAGPYNQAEVRQIAGTTDTSRDTIRDYIDRWVEERADEIRASAHGYPILVVAAEGGGIRAAYWTAGILTALVDQEPRIAHHMLAVSGVSGGSVGAGVFVGLLTAAKRGEVACSVDGKLAPCVRQVLGGDLLSPQLLAALVSDGFRSATQSPWLNVSDIRDRTVMLEESLEQAFWKATGQDLLAAPFASLWAGSTVEPPLLVSNLTEVSTGRRAVLAPLGGGDLWPDAIDAASRFNVCRLRASTAMVLSARFPGVSTTGHFANSAGTLRLVDGGYVDNSGAASAKDVFDALRTASSIKKLKLGHKIKPVVLFIRNGDERTKSATDSTIGRTLAGTVFDPVSTLIGVGGISATRYSRDLEREVKSWDGQVFDQFRLDYRDDRFPLGWMLAPQTLQRLDMRILEIVESAGNAAKLASLLPPSPAPASGLSSGHGFKNTRCVGLGPDDDLGRR